MTGQPQDFLAFFEIAHWRRSRENSQINFGCNAAEDYNIDLQEVRVNDSRLSVAVGTFVRALHPIAANIL